MTFAPGVQSSAPSAFVSTVSSEGYAAMSRPIASTPASATYPAVQRAYYFPIITPSICTIYRFFWLNGATVGTNNFQVGIYYDNSDGPGDSYLLGTSTLSAGTANRCQFDDVTNTALPPGKWWLAIWGSGTTATLFRAAPSAAVFRPTPGYLESSLAGGLPANATPAQNTTPYIPVFGFTTVSAP